MQIISYPVHYQSVCTNFDFSLFSRISCTAIRHLLEAKRAYIGFELHENSLQKQINNIGKIVCRRQIDIALNNVYHVVYSPL